MNSLNIIGTLGRDPQINAAGTVASISIAVKRKFKNKQMSMKQIGLTAKLSTRQQNLLEIISLKVLK